MLRDEYVKMEPGLRPVSYGRLGDVSHAFQRWRICPFPIEEVLGRLRSEIEAADLWNLHEIDPQALLGHEGYAISPARQLLFFHARYVVRILAIDPAALLEVPLKFIVLELPEGGGVTVRWADPIASFARYRNFELEELGRELSEACDGIVGALLRPDSPAPYRALRDAVITRPTMAEGLGRLFLEIPERRLRRVKNLIVTET